MQKAKPVNDLELINSCKTGDEGAWHRLYKEFYAKVRHTITFPLWRFSATEIEDLTQESFLEILRSLNSFRGDSSLGTFIVRITKNVCISYLRKKNALKRPKYVHPEPEMQHYLLPASNDDYDAALIHNEELEYLKISLTQISNDCQTIIKLRYFEEKSYEELVAIMKLPLGTISSRLKRCLLKLKEIMQNYAAFCD
jgi:RNA polymerase sigma factor (sigma-70 family)